MLCLDLAVIGITVNNQIYASVFVFIKLVPLRRFNLSGVLSSMVLLLDLVVAKKGCCACNCMRTRMVYGSIYTFVQRRTTSLKNILL